MLLFSIMYPFSLACWCININTYSLTSQSIHELLNRQCVSVFVYLSVVGGRSCGAWQDIRPPVYVCECVCE